MRRVIVYCEGPTEETFVNRVLKSEFYAKEIFLSASSCGGVSKYSIIKRDLNALCKSDPSAIVTTMLDYYAIPSETPGISLATQCDIYERISIIEQSIKEDIGMPNLITNLVLHEFEALLFSKPECFAYCGLPQKAISQLSEIRASVISPEHINNNPNTAPSKQILQLFPSYNKVLDGYNIAKDIGVQTIRRECRHFNEWLQQIESLADE